ncbi:MAG TPA: MlaD family protein [Methylomirabilota bacterium]|nr:MlaD family protein [Methylomirabilota bacterium]
MKNTLETRLGLFFMFALIVSVFILEMIGAMDFLKSSYKIGASFRNVQELKKGDMVKMAGVEIGWVDDIFLEGGRARVVMKIQSKFEIKTDARAVIKFTGLMGQNFVSIDGGSDAAPKVLAGGVLETYEQPDLSLLMAKLENVATGVEGLTKSFSPDNFSTLLGPLTDFMRQNRDNLTLMIGNMKTVSDQVAQGRGSVGRLIMDEAFYDAAYGTATNLQVAASDLRNLIRQADTMIGQARLAIEGINKGQGTLGKLTTDDRLYREGADAMTNLKEILQKMNQGQGSIGQLINDESFLKNAKLTLQKVEKATEGLEDQGPLSVLGIAVGTLF